MGVEPGDAMREIAERDAPPNVRVVKGWSHETGLATGSADLVLAVQAMHWMEPTSTLLEVQRLLRPGGVFAALDCDWPPSSGDADADQAWADCRKAVRLFEKRLGLGLQGAELHAPTDLGDPELREHTVADTHVNRVVAPGVRSWSKEQHLARMIDSGVFRWCHEIVFHRVDQSEAERFVGLLRSQGDYQTLRRAGFSDDELGATRVEQIARRSWRGGTRPMVFSYRVRLGIRS